MSGSLEPGSLIAGKYSVDGVLGTGGMGSVYAATNTAIGRRVAIKVLISNLVDKEDIQRRFELEAQAAAVIGHPGIVDVLDMGETEEGEPFIVMEYLEGATLRQVYKSIGPFTPAEAVAVVVPMLDALSAAHQAGVIHRDIKPANIFICTKPTRAIKLLDFGVSRFGKGSGLTQTGTAMGTPQYMSPEQVLGEKDVGPESDLYSVGAVLYHLLGGRPPYDADSDMATLARVLTEEHKPLKTVRPELPDALCRIVDKLLIKERAKRSNDAALVRKALAAAATPGADRIFESATTIASRTTSSPSVKKPVSRPRTRPPQGSMATVPAATNRLPLVIGGVVGALVLVAGGLGLYAATRPAPEPPKPVAQLVPPPPPVAEDVAITLSAEPAEARFSVNGEALDCNPCSLTRKTGTTVAVRVQADKYVPSDLELVFDKAREKKVSLVPLPPEAAAAGTRKGGGKKPPKGGLTVDERNPYQ